MLLQNRFLRRRQLSVGYRKYSTLKSTFRTVHLSEIRRRPANWTVRLRFLRRKVISVGYISRFTAWFALP